jgi:hypothetical protein
MLMSKKPKTTNKVADYAALAALGIARVEITYDGCSDSGCIEAVSAYDLTGQAIEQLPEAPVNIRVRDTVWNETTQEYQQRFIEKSVPVRDAIEHWCYELLEDHFPGWEIDDGSCGTISIDVKKRRGQLEHEARYTDYTLYSVRFS